MEDTTYPFSFYEVQMKIPEQNGQKIKTIENKNKDF
jgi:hypothetical protein